MRYRIIGDSCCDLTKEELAKEHFVNIPLTLLVEDYEFIDDDTFDQADFLKKVASTSECPKSACPAPEAYLEAYRTAEDIYVVTLSAELSGSCNSAQLAKKLYEEEGGKANIHIFNSCSASSGQLLICRRIEQLASEGKPFAEVIRLVEAYMKDMHTYFVLETLDFLKKNGRLSKVQAILAGALNIKPVMGATPKGEIIKLGQMRGMKKALMGMLDQVIADGTELEKKPLVIAHCNCYDRAMMVKEELLKRAAFASIDIVDTHGVSSLYAGDGGIIIAC